MANLTGIVLVLATALWAGTLVFFTFVATPILFRRLPERAGEVVGVLFPGYYAFGYTAGGVALLAALAAGEAVARGPVPVLLGAGLLLTLGGGALRPAVHTAAPAGRSSPRFRRLHGISMAVNLLATLAVLTAVGLLGASVAP